VTENGALSAGEDGGQPTSPLIHSPIAEGIDAAVEEMQPTGFDPAPNCPHTQTGCKQLIPR
jgi:hypothetical protein